MASSITVESLDLGESLGEEKDALVTHKRLAEKAGLSEKIATFLVSTVGCRTIEDPETCRRRRQTMRPSQPSQTWMSHRHGQPTES